MDCRDIRKKLSDSSGGPLPPDDNAAIDRHLRECRECTEFAAEIKKTVETLRALEELEPPAWLTAKVMKRISSEARPGKHWIERLFFPLHIKLPLEAFAALLITVAAIFIFRNMEPELQQLPVQSHAPAIRSMPAEPEKELRTQKIRKKEMEQPQRFAEETKQKDNVAGIETREMTIRKEHKPVERSAPAPVTPTMPAPTSSFAPSPALSPVLRQAETGKASGMAARDEGMQRAAPAAPVSEFMTAKKAVGLPTLTLTVKALDTAIKEIGTYIIKNKATVETVEQSESRIVLTVTLDPEKTGKFIEQISTIGTLKEDHQASLYQSSSFKLIIEKQ